MAHQPELERLALGAGEPGRRDDLPDLAGQERAADLRRKLHAWVRFEARPAPFRAALPRGPGLLGVEGGERVAGAEAEQRVRDEGEIERIVSQPPAARRRQARVDALGTVPARLSRAHAFTLVMLTSGSQAQ